MNSSKPFWIQIIWRTRSLMCLGGKYLQLFRFLSRVFHLCRRRQRPIKVIYSIGWLAKNMLSRLLLPTMEYPSAIPIQLELKKLYNRLKQVCCTKYRSMCNDHTNVYRLHSESIGQRNHSKQDHRRIPYFLRYVFGVSKLPF